MSDDFKDIRILLKELVKSEFGDSLNEDPSGILQKFLEETQPKKDIRSG